jgi:hypothetical protein
VITLRIPHLWWKYFALLIGQRSSVRPEICTAPREATEGWEKAA